MPFPGPVVVLGTMCWILFANASVLYTSFVQNDWKPCRNFLAFVGKWLLYASYFFGIWLFIMFLLWLVLGALINSEGFLPYAVMAASVFFAIYIVSSSYSGAREIVARFIEENLDLLLTIAISHWFKFMGLKENKGNEELGRIQLDKRRDILRNKMLEAKQTLLMSYKRLQQKKLRSEKKEVSFVAENTKLMSSEAQKLKRILCSYVLSRVDASPGNSFVIIHGRPTGLEHEIGLPVGTRFATVNEVERNVIEVNGMLQGFDMAILYDGVKLGPKFGNRVERNLEDRFSYALCIAAIPRFPRSKDLSNDIKIKLIFSWFDKDDDSYLNEIELAIWQAILKKPEFDRWEDTVAYYEGNYNIQIDREKGASLDSISSYYNFLSKTDGDLIRRDYERLFPVKATENDKRAMQNVFETCSDDFDDIIFDDDEFGENTSGDEDKFEARQRHEKVMSGKLHISEKDKQVESNENCLGSTINTESLKKIYYSIITEEQHKRDAATEKISDSFLSQKIVDTQFELLSPIFSLDSILCSCYDNDSQLSMNMPIKSKRREEIKESEERYIDLLKYVGLKSVHDLTEELHVNYLHVFEPQILKKGISSFYDHIMAQKIAAKAKYILNPRIDLQRARLQVSSMQILKNGLPKTAFDVLNSTVRYRISRDSDITENLTDASLEGRLQLLIQVSLLVQILVNVQVILAEDVEKHFTESLTWDGSIKEIVLWVPRQSEVVTFLGTLLEKHTRKNLSALTIDTVFSIITFLISNYLWLGAFLMLLQLMGIDLKRDSLPGGSPIPESKDLATLKALINQESQSYFRYEGSSNSNSNVVEKTEINFVKVKKVFDQLSNSTGFLPVDLVDEAIVLLTDNSLNYAGVVACLEYLNLGGVGRVGNNDVNSILQDLGFSADFRSYNIESSSDVKEPVLDWTEYTEGNWLNAGLIKKFHKLTACTPGFMGKSQMMEFIGEIEKLFTPHPVAHSFTRESNLINIQKINLRDNRPGHEDIIPENHAEVSDYSVLRKKLSSKKLLSVTLEMFHQAATKLEFSFSRSHSSLIWVLYCQEAYGCIAQFLPAEEIAIFTVKLYLKPLAPGGNLLDRREGIEDAVQFQGCVNLTMFRDLLIKLGIDISRKGIHNIWTDFPKDPMKISFKDSSSGIKRTKYIRVEMDKTGFDTTKGRTVHVNMVKNNLAKFLCTGLWPAGLMVLCNLKLQLDVSRQKMDSVLSGKRSSFNRYGLLRVEDIASLISEAGIEGLSFPMLRSLLKMRLKLPEQDIKRMFDLMDVNHDHTLDINEFLAGFGMLFQKFVPNQIVDVLGLSYLKQLYTTFAVVSCLLAFFSFLGFALTAFVGLRSGVSAAVQSIIALVGAVGLQSGATESIERLQKRMKHRVAVIIGEDLDKKKKERQEEEEKHISIELAAGKQVASDKKPSEIRYILPLKYRPSLEDPKPCVTFYPGDDVFLEPVVGGIIDVSTLSWKIFPRIPCRTGLNFDTGTGVISGTISYPAPRKSTESFPVEHILGNEESLEHVGNHRVFVVSQEPVEGGAKTDSLVEKELYHNITMRKKTFVVTVRNSSGSARCLVTFQISNDFSENPSNTNDVANR